MTRFSCCALAFVAALTVSSGAYARTHHHHRPIVTPGASAATAGAHASAVSEGAIQQQCAEVARARWGTNSQDMQTPRDFAYRDCMFDRGIRNP